MHKFTTESTENTETASVLSVPSVVNSALDLRAIVLPFTNRIFELATPSFPRIDISEKKISKSLEIRLFRAVEPSVSERFDFLKFARLFQEDAREQQIRSWSSRILLDQHPHLLFSPAGVAEPQKQIAEIETRGDRLRMIGHFRFIGRARFGKAPLTLAQ